MNPATNPLGLAQMYQAQFSHHFRVTRRLLELAREVPDTVYRAANAYSHHSLHGTFAHMIGAAYLWRNVIADTLPPDFNHFSSGEAAGIDEQMVALQAEDDGWPALLSAIDEVTLLGNMTRQSPIGARRIPVWRTIQHVILHGVQHQSDIARMLTEAGLGPGDIDFFWDEPAA